MEHTIDFTQMTENEKELANLFLNATETEQEFILNALFCAVEFGEAFFDEIKVYVEKGNRKGIQETVGKYTSLLKAQVSI